jgi:hypothetical protein
MCLSEKMEVHVRHHANTVRFFTVPPTPVLWADEGGAVLSEGTPDVYVTLGPRRTIVVFYTIGNVRRGIVFRARPRSGRVAPFSLRRRL